jgi:hypothetical protein
MSFLKALFPGSLASWLLATIIGSQGLRGGVMAIQRIYVDQYDFYWSWPVFMGVTGLAWALFLMME